MNNNSRNPFKEAKIEEFGKILKKFRQNTGKTAKEAAKICGIDYGYWCKLENGRVPYLPTAEYIEKICAKLGLFNQNILDLFNAAERIAPNLMLLFLKVQASTTLIGKVVSLVESKGGEDELR